MNKEPTGPYVYQSHGLNESGYASAGRLWAVSGIHHLAVIDGLTKTEAERVCAALNPEQSND